MRNIAQQYTTAHSATRLPAWLPVKCDGLAGGMLTLLLLRGLARSATARMASFAAALLLRKREKKPPEPPLPRAGDAGFLTPRGGDGGGELPTGELFWPARRGSRAQCTAESTHLGASAGKADSKRCPAALVADERWDGEVKPEVGVLGNAG